MRQVTKAELEAEVKRLQKSLERCNAGKEALKKSLDHTKKQLTSSRTLLSEARNALQDRSAELSDSLAREAATGEILRIISRSPTDTQPVFDAIVGIGIRLFNGANMSLRLVKGEYTEIVATTLPIRSGDNAPVPIATEKLAAIQALRAGEVVHIPDTLAAGFDAGYNRRRNTRSIVCVPLLNHDKAIGVLSVFRPAPGPFTDQQIALLKSFADQAVIAIENVRLFKELQARNAEIAEALEQQIAISEILRVMSDSPTDVQPVLDTVVSHSARICDANDVRVWLVDGDVLRYAAGFGVIPGLDVGDTRPLNRGWSLGRAVVDRAPLQIEDTSLPESQKEFPLGHAYTERFGARTVFAVPLLREGKALGGILLRRREPRTFTPKQMALLKTFADQAVIAIENVRLFKELQAKNAELTATLEQQTATADILKVISASPTDTRPVFDAIAKSCQRLFHGKAIALALVRGELVEVVAMLGDQSTGGIMPPPPPFALDRGSLPGICILDSRIVHVPDFEAVVAEFPRVRELGLERGYRSGLFVPLLQNGKAIGSLGVPRGVTGEFTEKEIALLRTFADQAVIAIDNVRLFKELQARNAEITEALEQQTATAEILKVISRSPPKLQPVFDAILENAMRLCDAHMGILSLYDGDKRIYVAQRGGSAEYVNWAANRGPVQIPLGGTVERMLAERRPIQSADLRDLSGYRDRTTPGLVALVELGGARSQVIVPMLKEGRVVGDITIYHPEVRPFTQKQIDLVSTFADQAVIAIENVRLFNEIQEKNRQLEIANRHKSEFLANMSHELRTPLNAVIGFSEVLQQGMVGELNEKQGEYLNYIHTSGSHLLSLINDILDLSKVEAGRMELDLTHFNVPVAIDNALTLIRERATRHGLALESAVDPSVAEIDADERKFKQVLLNLLSNAVKFTPEGGRITVAARPLDGMLEVSVSDTGIGIAPEDCEAVFEEFRQVGTHTEGKAQGTGLGLALTKKFIELHGGRIRLTSAVGQGSTFSFTLPIEQPHIEAAA